MKAKHICIVADNYPTENDPTFPFVEQLAEAIVKNGIDVTVIAPQNVLKYICKCVRFAEPKKKRAPPFAFMYYGETS